MKQFLDILLNTLGILGIVVFGAFILVLVIDLILSAMDGNRDGIFFKRSKDRGVSEGTFDNDKVSDNYNVIEEEKSEYNPIDMQKALEEQRMLEAKMNQNVAPVVEQPQEPLFTNLEKIVEDDEDFFEEEGETELETILNDLTKQIKAEEEDDKPVKEEINLFASIVEPEPEPVVEEEKVEVPPTVLVDEQPVVEVQPKTIIKEKVVYLDDDENIKELRKLRKDILINKNEALQKQAEDEEKERELEQKLKELDELKDFKRKVQSEKGMNIRNRVKNISENSEIIKENQAQRKKNRMLEEEKARLAEEKEKLAKELEDIKQTPVQPEETDKPYFTRDYYVSKLESLEKEFADVNKELRANKREYNPIVKCKKALARDGEKLRKKEAIVAKQKIALYGVNAPKNIDPEKKKKLDEEMAILKELKDSVLHCEEVINQNADRFPILEKTNKLLTKQVDRLTKEIETVKEAIKWYDEH